MSHRQQASPALGPRLAELGLLLYLAQIPLAAIVGPAAQAPAWVAILVGLLIVQGRAWSASSRSAEFRCVWPTLAFFASFALSILTSEDMVLSAGRAIFLPMGLLFFFGVQAAEGSLDARRRLSALWLFVFGALGIQGLYQAVMGEALLSNQQLYAGRIRSGLPHPNDIALVPLVLPLVIWGVRASERPWMKLLGVLGLALGLVSVLLSSSRNALIGVAVGFCVLTLFSRRRRLWWIGGGVAVLIGLVWVGVQPESALNRLIDPEILQRDGRIGLWLSAFEIFESHPLTGAGPFLFDRLYVAYLDSATLPAGYQPEQGYLPWVHNLYLEALAERGLIGLMTLGILIAAALRRVGQGLRATPGAEVERHFAQALGACWAVFLVMGLLDMTFLKDWVLVVFMLLVGLSAILPRPSSVSD